MSAPNPNPPAPHVPNPSRLATKAQTQRYFLVSRRTVENWWHRRLIDGYHVPGLSGLFFDLDQIEAALATHGPTVMRDGRGLNRRGTVVNLPVVAAETFATAATIAEMDR